MLFSRIRTRMGESRNPRNIYYILTYNILPSTLMGRKKKITDKKSPQKLNHKQQNCKRRAEKRRQRRRDEAEVNAVVNCLVNRVVDTEQNDLLVSTCYQHLRTATRLMSQTNTMKAASYIACFVIMNEDLILTYFYSRLVFINPKCFRSSKTTVCVCVCVCVSLCVCRCECVCVCGCMGV